LDSGTDASTVERGTVFSNVSTVDDDMSEWLHQRQRRDLKLFNSGRWSDCQYPIKTEAACEKACSIALKRVGESLYRARVINQRLNTWPSNCWVYKSSRRTNYCYWNPQKSSKSSTDRCTAQARCVCNSGPSPTVAPTVAPTKYPTEHPCVSGNHACDKTDKGVCNIDNSEYGYACACKKGYKCQPACDIVGHYCEEETKAPTSSSPTQAPTESPTMSPTISPTLSPTVSPTTSLPTVTPTTSVPTVTPTDLPSTTYPSISPSTSNPTTSPTLFPSVVPTLSPTVAPSAQAFFESSMNQAFVGAGAAGFVLIVIIVVLVVYVLNLTKTTNDEIERYRGPPGEMTHIDKQTVSFENPMYDDAAEAQDGIYDSPAFINETDAPGYMEVEAEESDDTDLDDMDGEESEHSRDSD